MQALRALFVGSLLVLACSALSFAQTGTIQGTVTDAVGAVVQSAEVTIRNIESNAARAVPSNGTGAYAVTDLPAGSYEITIKKEGFRLFHVQSTPLTVAQVLTINAKLELGAVTEEVQVNADRIQDLDLESSQVSNLVDQRQITDLPLITRDPYSLILLSPGTSQTNTSLGGITVNGSRERNNNFLLDGVDNNDTSVPGIIGGVLSANPDSAQEFRVITNNFNAEFGRNTGAIVDVVTKSGTNTFHGGVYEFGRWNGFGGARDYFNPAIDANGNPSPLNPYIRNQFGYSIGGPIHKNKTFFFFNEEFQRFITTLTDSAIVPTAAFKTGVFTYTDANGGQHPIDLTDANTLGQNNFDLPLDPTVQKILALYPNAPSSADGISGTIFFPSSSRQKSYQTVAKIDQHINDKNTLSLRYGYDHFFDPNPGHADNLPGGIGSYDEKSISEALGANLTSSFGNNVVNQFNFGWNHIYAAFDCTGTSTIDSVSPVDQYGNGTDYYMDPFSSFGCTSLVADGQFRKTGTVSYGDALSWVHGSHTFKFGFDFRDIGESGADNFFSRRQVNLNTFQLFGDPNNIGFNLIDVPGVTDNPSGFTLSDAASAIYGFVGEDFNAEYFNKSASRVGTDNKNFRQHEYDWFAQDAWKIRRNLTLTLGLRYQLDGVPFEENADFSNLLTSPASFPVVFTTIGPGTGNQIYKQDYSNIEPRVGFSWDPWGDGKTAVRGAFGLFHDRVFGNLFGNARGNPPFEQDYLNYTFDTMSNALASPGSVDFPAFAPLQTPSATVADGSALAPVIFDPNFRNTASNNWNFGIQRDLPGTMTMDLSYVGSKGTHIDDQIDGNPPDPNLVQSLVNICSNPNDPQNTTGCTPSEVSGIYLFEGADFGVLPFNAVAHNALVQPYYQVSRGVSSYNALQFKLTRRLSHGLELQGSYTWAHALDDTNDPLAPAQGNRTYPRNSLNILQDWGNSDNDVRHIGVISYVYELPLGRGKGYLNSGFAGKLFEGMQLSGITSMQTGHPFEIRSTTDSQRTGIDAWGALVGDPFAPTPAGTTLGTGKPFFTNPAAFTQPTFGGPSNVARNQYFGPGLVNFDVAFAKKMKLGERVELETRFEGYNIFNHPHFANPGDFGSSLGNIVESGNSNFGVITSTTTQPDGTTSARQIQVAMKLNF